MADIFLSYAKEDHHRVAGLAGALEARGWTVWWDRSIAAGSRWDEVIQRELEAARCVVVVWTRHAVESQWVRTEAMEGLDRGILVPVKLERVTIPLAFKRTQAAALEDWTPGHAHAEFDRFVTAVAAMLGRAVAPGVEVANLAMPRERRWRQRFVATIALVVAGAAVLASGVWWWRATGGGQSGADFAASMGAKAPLILRSAIELPADAPLVRGGALIGYDSTGLALSPDERWLAYVGERDDGQRQIFLRDLTQFEIKPVPGTEGAIHPFFSPDGRRLGFLTDDKVKSVALDGSALETLADAQTPVFATWQMDGTIYFSENESRALSAVSGGSKRTVAASGRDGLGNVVFTDVLPGGRAAVVCVRKISQGRARLALLKLPGLELVPLIDSACAGWYVPTGHMLFAKSGDLHAIAFDVRTLATRGVPQRVVSGVAMESTFGRVQVAVSSGGLLAYGPGGDGSIARLQWIDRAGHNEPLAIPEGIYGVFALAPDDRRVAIATDDVTPFVALFDLVSGTNRKIPAAGPEVFPRWAPEGDRVLVRRSVDDKYTLGWHPLEDPSSFVPVLNAVTWRPLPVAWLRSGGIVVSGVSSGVGLLTPPDAQPMPLANLPSAFYGGLSMDEKWIAYGSQETGRYEIWISSFPDGNIKRQVSTGGGTEPVWSRNGAELFFRNGSRFFACKLRGDSGLQFEPPRLVWEVPGFVDTAGISYDVSMDGQRLLVLTRVHEPVRTRIHLVQNWTAELRE